MSTRERKLLQPATAVGVVVCLWLGYTTLQTLSVMERVDGPKAALLSFLPGLLGVGVLLAAGFSRADCYLQFMLL